MFEAGSEKYDWMNCIIAVGPPFRLPDGPVWYLGGSLIHGQSGNFEADILQLFSLSGDIHAMSKTFNLGS